LSKDEGFFLLSKSLAGSGYSAILKPSTLFLNFMMKYWALAIFILITSVSYSQKAVFINSGEIMKSAQTAYDSGNYEAAIGELRKIHERDTNYVESLGALAYAYLDNKQFDKALETCELALKEPSKFKAHLSSAKGLALDKIGQFQAAVDFLKNAINDFPGEYQLHYHLGNVYYYNKDYNNARDCYFRALSINPFHAYSHLNLGAVAMKLDHKVHAMLSYGLYLGIKPNDNNRLVIIDKFVTNQAEAEEKVAALNTPNAFEKLDQIVRAMMVNDKNFKSQFPFNVTTAKQFEMLFQQLDLNSKDENDPWLKFYLPLYKSILAKNQVEPFVYHLFTSTSIEQVKKWQKKNDKVLQEFFNNLSTELKTKRLFPVLPSRFPEGTQGWYNDNGDLAALGKANSEDKEMGSWQYFWANGQLRSEGNYGKPEVKTGVWKYYDEEGRLSKIENQDTGEMTGFHPNGNKRNHYFFKDGKTNGTVELFYLCGTLSEKLNYNDDEVDGLGETYYPNGKVKEKFSHIAGKFDGEYITHFEDGKLKNKFVYKAGKVEGPHIEYFANGKIATTGTYLNNEMHGEWKYYYSNGKLNRVGSFNNGKGTGEWKYYNHHGQLTEVRPFDSEERLNGENQFFSRGNLFCVYTYNKGLIVQLRYYDRSKKEIGSFGNKDGNFKFKTFFPTGELKAEGAYKKGELDGEQKFYYRTGQLLSKYLYKDGELQGESTEYYGNGSKKSVSRYSDNALDGYYQSFFLHGQVESEGYFVKGNREQQWLTYYPDGTLEHDYYYLHGDAYNRNLDFAPDGKPIGHYVYGENEYIKDIVHFNARNEKMTKVSTEGSRIIFDNQYSNKKSAGKFEILCGSFYQTLETRTPDGTKLSSATLVAGEREGKYQSFDFAGTLTYEGFYVHGKVEGAWKGYHGNGKIDYSGWYFNDEPDSVWTYNYPSGEVHSLIPYATGERNGVAKYFAPDGTPTLEKEWYDDDIIAYREMTQTGWGEWKKFTGDATVTSFYPNGQKSSEEQYKSGELDGIRRIYFNNGKVCSEHNLVAGDYQGPFFTSYSNGVVFRKGNFSNDELNGKMEYFNPDGTPLKTEEFLNGDRHGHSILYKNKAKVKDVKYFGGLPND
jgi:uncharacterized protein